MSKELDYFFDMQISVKDKEQSEALIEILDECENHDIVTDYSPDWDEGREMYWMISVQFYRGEQITKFLAVLEGAGYKI